MENDQPADDQFPLAAPPWIKLRGLVILIAIIAVIVGVPLAETLDVNRAQQHLIAAHVGVAIAAFAAFVIGYGLQRRHLSRQAGPLLLELNGNWTRVYSAWDHDAFVVLGLVLLNLGISRYAEDLQTLAAPGGRVELNWITTLPMLAAAILLMCIGVWDVDVLQLRKKGVILGVTYVPWEKLKTCRWSGHEENVLLIGSGTLHRFPVSSRERAEIDAILANAKAAAEQPQQAKG